MKKEIKVSGHLEVIKGIYHMKLSWVSAEGKRQRKSKSTELPERGNKKRAQDMLIDFQREQEAELVANGNSTKDILFTDYMKQWLEKMKLQIRPTTYSGYHDNVYGIIIPYFKPMKLKLRDVTPKHIQDFYTKQRQRVKGTTVKSYHANIHKAFKDARKLQLIDSNPMECVDPPKKEPYHGQTYTVEEAQKILALISDTIFEIPITMMLFYGLRREEAIGLKWQNIDFDNDTFLIAHTVTETKVDRHLQMVKEDLTKNSSSYRSLPLVAPVKELLLEKKQSIQEYRKLFRRSYYREDSDYVCVNEIGELIKPRTLSDNFKRIIRQNKIRNLRLYDCRHTAASIMLKNGVNMKKIQMILGHSDYATTANIYSHLDYTDKISATETMKEIIYGKDNETV
ncbi:MAG: site-specific integrase [Ruminococcaceae bacterium]|nr:site-specific integrase [Oscillospiraceae bacterium]